MSLYAIWIDRQEAKLFEFTREKMERSQIHARNPEHHGVNEHKFYAEVASHLAGADQILILGPGVAKHHFQNHLMEQIPLLAKKIVACETVDQPTDAQIGALARKFFRMGYSPARS